MHVPIFRRSCVSPDFIFFAINSAPATPNPAQAVASTPDTTDVGEVRRPCRQTTSSCSLRSPIWSSSLILISTLSRSAVSDWSMSEPVLVGGGGGGFFAWTARFELLRWIVVLGLWSFSGRLSKVANGFSANFPTITVCRQRHTTQELSE